MAIIPGATQFIGISPEIDLTEKKSSRLNSETQPYTLNDIKDSVATTPAGSTGQIQFNNAGAFGASSSLFWDNTNSRLGIGTSSPTAKLTIGGTLVSGFGLELNDGSYRGSFTTNNGGTSLQGWSNGLTLGANGRDDMKFTWDGNNYSTSTSFTFGASSSLGARLGIKGSGSTSATTSLLVQNSGGTNLLSVRDDSNVYLGTNTSSSCIYVPRDSGFGYGYFMRIAESGHPLLATISNAGLLLATNNLESNSRLKFTSYNYGLYSPDAIGTNNVCFPLTGGLNTYGGTGISDACSLVHLNCQNSTLQAGGSAIFQKISGTINEAGGGGTKVIAGTYYNPTIIGGTNYSHYCYYATSGAMIINSSTPNASAILQADSTTQGFLPPRMTTTQINAIASPAVGLMAYNTTLDCPVFYSAGGWRKISHSAM